MAFTAQSVSVLNGQDVVDVNSAESIENIKAGDFLQIGSFPLVEIKQAYKNGQGQKFIQLTKAWELTTQNNQPAIVIPTSGEFRAAVKALQDANILVNDNQQALQDYQNNLGTVTFKKSDGTTTTVKTLKQIEADNQAQMNAYHPYPWAMRKAEFEAMRAANNEKFAASGFVYKGKRYTDNWNNGYIDSLFSPSLGSSEAANNLFIGSLNSSAIGNSKQGTPRIVIAGVETELEYLSSSNKDLLNKIKLPPAEDGTRTYDSATGESRTHATPTLAFASETATNKVVTARVDIRTFEGFLREINDDDPFIYKNGIIQSLATNISGVPTITDNTRPVEYFAWYSGDKNSRGKGVNWQTATEAQRIAIASDRKNHIYFNDETGKFYQWCIRGRSFAGKGNGDWAVLDLTPSSSGPQFAASKSNNTRIRAQGVSNNDAAYNNDNGTEYAQVFVDPNVDFAGLNRSVDRGIRVLRDHPTNTDKAIDNQCYLYIFGTDLRLNKGSYHPGFNHLGSARISLLDANGNSNGNDSFWYSSGGAYGTNPFESGLANNPASCFVLSDPRGNIVGSRSGRPDGRYHDGICVSGQGGVCRDMRYSSWGLTAEDFAEADLKIKSGKYRGMEKLLRTCIVQGSLTATGSSRNIYIADSTLGSLVTEGTRFYVVSSDGVVQSSIVGTVGVTGFISNETLENLESIAYVVVSKDENISISDEYDHTEVFGAPADILLCDALKEGWVGSWNPEIPDGTIKSYRSSKPYISTNKHIFSDNKGASWGVSGITFDAIKGEISQNFPLGQIRIIDYKTKAKMTVPYAVTDVHGRVTDVDCLFTSMDASDSKGRALNYSLTGLIQTHLANAEKIGVETLFLNSLPAIPATARLWGLNKSAGELRHSPLRLDAPSNNSPAFKALNYNTKDNQQGFINYAYAELHYDAAAGDWGDDGKIHIADNQTTMPDENGHTVLVGTARCVEPLGWIKNDK
jgi:hypothetical protein